MTHILVSVQNLGVTVLILKINISPWCLMSLSTPQHSSLRISSKGSGEIDDFPKRLVLGHVISFMNGLTSLHYSNTP